MRRLQRFFQHVRLGQDWAAPILAATLGTERWTLVLDRTNWTIGRAEVNYLVLAAVTRRRRVPLLWTLLPLLSRRFHPPPAGRPRVRRGWLAPVPQG